MWYCLRNEAKMDLFLKKKFTYIFYDWKFFLNISLKFEKN